MYVNFWYIDIYLTPEIEIYHLHALAASTEERELAEKVLQTIDQSEKKGRTPVMP